MVGARPIRLEPDCVLAFRPATSVHPIDDRAVLLIRERARHILTGALVVGVAALVDGRRTVGEIVRAAGPTLGEAQTLYALTELVAHGHVVAAGTLAGDAVFWDAVDVDPRSALVTLAEAAVAVYAVGDAGAAAAMAEALRAASVRVSDDAPVTVVTCDDYLQPELAGIDARARRDNTAWFLVRPVGTAPLVGPMFRPGAGACWHCLAFWLRQARPVEEFVRRRWPDAPVPLNRPPVIDASLRAACAIASLAIARALLPDGGVALHDRLLALDLVELHTTTHAVVRRPQCPACGDPTLMAARGRRPISLRAVPRAHVEDGGYRQHTPRWTYERFRDFISPLTGPVTHLAPLPGRDTELRAVFSSGYLVCPNGDLPLSHPFDRPCAGKGRSADQARVSALCEALERYSGVYQGDEARVRGSKRWLGDAALDLAALLHISDRQYRLRDQRNAAARDHRERVPARLDDDTEIDWTPAWSLNDGSQRFVPLPYCFAEAPPEAGVAFCPPCGNGVAAGTCIEEAALQAILELVERDAAAVWWYNRVRRPQIDLESFGDAYFAELHADYARAGWRLWVLDLTHDLGIPVCVALAHQPALDRFASGLGCHVAPRLAVQRALTELNQIFDPGGTSHPPWALAELPDRGYLFPAEGAAPRAAADLPRLDGADLAADVAVCVDRLRDAGLAVYLVDKTRPDVGLAVVQALVPGLRHFFPRFAPGRLYDVPCALGWLPRPWTEDELNPVPLLL
jgi:ribosomal protein S12 methylthiotransferase accessory factor